MNTPTGTVFDIKRIAVHDGPGIRITVFLKDAPKLLIFLRPINHHTFKFENYLKLMKIPSSLLDLGATLINEWWKF